MSSAHAARLSKPCRPPCASELASRLERLARISLIFLSGILKRPSSRRRRLCGASYGISISALASKRKCALVIISTRLCTASAKYHRCNEKLFSAARARIPLLSSTPRIGRNNRRRSIDVMVGNSAFLWPRRVSTSAASINVGVARMAIGVAIRRLGISAKLCPSASMGGGMLKMFAAENGEMSA